MGVRVIKSSEYKWRRLDNSAKIFPAASGLETSNVFRLSCVLKDDAEPNLLQQALEYTIKQFPAFNVRMHSGFFWYYFDANKKTPTVMHESMYPCAPMNRHENDGFLFRVLYHKKRISLETYHALTDGTGGLEFLCAIVTAYLTLKNGNRLPRHATADADGYKNASAVEDCYNKIYDKSAVFSPFGEKAYRIRGKRLPYTMTRIVSGELSASGLLAAAREKGVTLTAYLTALIIYSIYITRLDGKPEKRAVSVSLPVNLRAIFKEKSALNFFACVSAGLTFKKREPPLTRFWRRLKPKWKRR